MRFLYALLAIVAVSLPGRALAEPVRAFAGPAVDEATLASIRGGQVPFAVLTLGTAVRMGDAQFWADMRQVGTIGRVTMDVWWASTGAEIIASNVRVVTP